MDWETFGVNAVYLGFGSTGCCCGCFLLLLALLLEERRRPKSLLLLLVLVFGRRIFRNVASRRFIAAALRNLTQWVVHLVTIDVSP